MSKRYTCGKCKKKSFGNRFSLTRHLVSCGRNPGREGDPICQECKKKFKNWSALGAHRFRSHGVHGASRWSKASRKKKTRHLAPPSEHLPVIEAGIENEVVQKVANRILWHKEEARKHMEQAERLEKAAHTLREAF
jgi:hypothetical protein